LGKTDGALRAGELGQQSELDVIGNVRRVRGGPQIPGFLQRHTGLGGYKYTAFGKLLPPDAGAPLPDWGFFGVQPLDQPLRWQGRWFVDVAGGIYDFRNRWWSPELGAFLSPDEFDFATREGTLWSWPGQNPFAIRDPSGRIGYFQGAGASGAFQYGLWLPGASAASGVFVDLDPGTWDLSIGLYSTLGAQAGAGIYGSAGVEGGLITDISTFKGVSTGIGAACPIGTASATGIPPTVTVGPGPVGWGGGLWAGAVVTDTTLLGARINPFRRSFFFGFL
jgi:RHS repeat-associated protein